MAKVVLRFGCAKQSKNLEWYLVHKDQNYIPLFSNVGHFAKSHFDHAHFFAALKNTFSKKINGMLRSG